MSKRFTKTDEQLLRKRQAHAKVYHTCPQCGRRVVGNAYWRHYYHCKPKPGSE
jgi:hypothetical protein